MRVECRHYDSRTYANGEIVRKCRLDLAPEAPWRCPDDCPSFALRLIDAGWQYGTMRGGMAEPEAEPKGGDIAALLDAAEDIVNSAAPDILAEFDSKKNKKRSKLRRKKR